MFHIFRPIINMHNFVDSVVCTLRSFQNIPRPHASHTQLDTNRTCYLWAYIQNYKEHVLRAQLSQTHSATKILEDGEYIRSNVTLRRQYRQLVTIATVEFGVQSAEVDARNEPEQTQAPILPT
jgi:hypothetical protein